ncbi:hypothetical protein Emag_000566 [Eimeria magna]
MAVSFPQSSPEIREGEPAVFHSSAETSRRRPLLTLARPRRKQALRVGTLLTLLSILAIWTTLSACSYVLKKTVTKKQESLGRRLAAGEDRKEEEDLLAEILEECIGWREGLEESAGANSAREAGQVQPQAWASTHQPQQFTGELQLGEGSSSSASASEVAGADSTELQVTPTAPLLQADESTFQQLPPEMPLEDALRLLVWNDDDEFSTDLFTSQDSGQTSPSPVEPGEKRRTSSWAFEESAPATKRQALSVQSPEGVQDGATGATTNAYVIVSGSTGQEHAHVTQQPGARSQAPSATDQAAASDCAGGIISTASQMPGPVLKYESLRRALTSSRTSSGTPLAPGSTGGSPDAAMFPFPLPPPASPMPPSTHPYYRLPPLEPGRIPRSFNIARAFDSMSGVSVHPHLQTIRRLLLQPSITPAQAEPLITALEELVSHLYRFQRSPLDTKKPGIAAYLLARRYLSLEAVFIGVQLLGPAMHPQNWWPKLVQSIPSGFSRTLKRKRRYKKTTISSCELARRLSAAIALLKKGIRPSLRDTVQLKRDLFTNATVHLGLEEPKWDEWRKDDDGGEGTSSS